MKSTLFICSLVLTLSISFLACNSQTTEKINIYQMESFSEVKEDSLIVITDLDIINSIKEAFNNAEKQPGIVDIVEPHYKVEIDEDAYFLWITDDNGTIMNTKDTHTIYYLSNESVKEIKKIIGV